jgi:hypothetical protein
MLVQMSRDANANNGMRPALIDAAARLIATEGGAGLTLRRVAEEVGTSTMAPYARRDSRCSRAGPHSWARARILSPTWPGSASLTTSSP